MADSKLVKQEVNGTVILPPLVFPVLAQCFAIVTVNTLGKANLPLLIPVRQGMK
jgi:hypothetical protein